MPLPWPASMEGRAPATEGQTPSAHGPLQRVPDGAGEAEEEKELLGGTHGGLQIRKDASCLSHGVELFWVVPDPRPQNPEQKLSDTNHIEARNAPDTQGGTKGKGLPW